MKLTFLWITDESQNKKFQRWSLWLGQFKWVEFICSVIYIFIFLNICFLCGRVESDRRKENFVANMVALQRPVHFWKAWHFKDRSVENDHFNPSTSKYCFDAADHKLCCIKNSLARYPHWHFFCSQKSMFARKLCICLCCCSDRPQHHATVL